MRHLLIEIFRLSSAFFYPFYVFKNVLDIAPEKVFLVILRFRDIFVCKHKFADVFCHSSRRLVGKSFQRLVIQIVKRKLF